MKRALALIVAAGLGCAGGAPPQAASAPEPALVSTEAIAGNFLMRQQLSFESGDRRGGFDAVVQKHCDELVVVGLTPFGSRAFTLRQHGVEVEVETHVDVDWPFEPRRILLDVHRAYFLPLSDPPPADGSRELSFEGERVDERWRDGRLRERRFRRADGAPAGDVVIDYRDGASAKHAPTRIHIDNRRFGYRLEVVTIERRALSCP